MQWTTGTATDCRYRAHGLCEIVLEDDGTRFMRGWLHQTLAEGIENWLLLGTHTEIMKSIDPMFIRREKNAYIGLKW